MGRPFVRKFIYPHLSLFGQHIFLDLSPIFTQIRSPPQHKLISNNSHSKVIYSERMILPTHNFRSHIPWSTTCIVRVVLSVFSRNTKISNSHVTLRIQHQIFRLDISMNNFVLVHILQPYNEVTDKKFSLFLVKHSLISQMVPQITTIKVIHNEIKMLPVLKSIADIYQK